MVRIGLMSDTHGYLDDSVFTHFANCDEVWHAGDFGTLQLAEALMSRFTVRGVYGNIDGREIRNIFPEELHFTCEDVTVFMKHIGGYPGKYEKGVKEKILSSGAGIFISGHSHILKIMYDNSTACLHMNPGAAGRQGWHTKRTLVRFVIDGRNIKDCEIIEL